MAADWQCVLRVCLTKVARDVCGGLTHVADCHGHIAIERGGRHMVWQAACCGCCLLFLVVAGGVSSSLGEPPTAGGLALASDNAYHAQELTMSSPLLGCVILQVGESGLPVFSS